MKLKESIKWQKYLSPFEWRRRSEYEHEHELELLFCGRLSSYVLSEINKGKVQNGRNNRGMNEMI